MRSEHEALAVSETTPLLVPSTSSERPQGESEQLGGNHEPHFEWKNIVWVVAAIWSAVFLGALDGGSSLSCSLNFS
jgi:hypothetical protein